MTKTKKAATALAVGIIAILGVTATDAAIAGPAFAGPPKPCC